VSWRGLREGVGFGRRACKPLGNVRRAGRDAVCLLCTGNATHDAACCGEDAADWCFEPEALRWRMGDFLPYIAYYSTRDGEALLGLG
jgi:hypothetical protein